MANVLHIADAVVTGDLLKRQHKAQGQVCVGRRAVLTPTAWDYLREHRLQVVRGDVAVPSVAASVPAALLPTGAPGPAAPGTPVVREVPPTAVATPTQLVPENRCEHPDQPYGCKTDEFGSGFAEPSSCQDCQVHGECKKGKAQGDCEGCNRHRTFLSLAPADLEDLVKEITDQIMARLES